MAYKVCTLCQMYYCTQINGDRAGCVEGKGDKMCKQFLSESLKETKVGM